VTGNTAKHPKFKFLVLDIVSYQGTEHTFLKKSSKTFKKSIILRFEVNFENFLILTGVYFYSKPTINRYGEKQ